MIHHNRRHFFDSSYEYKQFTNSGFDLEITGLYQLLMRDIWKSFLEPKGDQAAQVEMIDEFFSNKANHIPNEKTGLLKGKNVIVVQMESLDDRLITSDSTPTIHRMMDTGINFQNMYTCIYGSGSTFGTEFAFNTGIYQGNKEAAAYTRARNEYSFSLPNILKNKIIM